MTLFTTTTVLRMANYSAQRLLVLTLYIICDIIVTMTAANYLKLNFVKTIFLRDCYFGIKIDFSINKKNLK